MSTPTRSRSLKQRRPSVTPISPPIRLANNITPAEADADGGSQPTVATAGLTKEMSEAIRHLSQQQQSRVRAAEATAQSKAQSETYNMDRVKLLFGSIDIQSLGYITRYQFEETLRENGVTLQDARLNEVQRRLEEVTQRSGSHASSEAGATPARTIGTPSRSPLESRDTNVASPPRPSSASVKSDSAFSSVCGEGSERIDLQRFAYIIQPNLPLIEKIIRRQLVIPDWQSFIQILTDLYHDTKGVSGGKVADYIPELALADKDWFGVSFCSVDGQLFSIGDTNREFSVQSSSKPISYLMALTELGEADVHRYVGREPSGRNFNEICLSPELIPHNPMVNSGAIMTCSLIKHQKEQSSRFRHIMDTWQAISGEQKYVTFSNSTYLSERATADRNFCLGYMMQENHSFSDGSTKRRHEAGRPWGANDLVKNLELYFQCCSIQTTAEGHAVIGSTLASGGRCSITNRDCFSGDHVRNCLSLMLSCGMYDYSGEWAYKIGLPAKSGVSGCLMVVIPNVGGLSIYSPPLDSLGNTVRGIEFCKRLVERCSFHYYDMVNGIVCSSSKKINPSSAKNSAYQNQLITLCTLCAKGDLTGIRALLSAGADANGADYDGRTPLHLAASEGQLAVVKYLCATSKIRLNPIDRFGGTPFSDAVREGHQNVAEYLFHKLKGQGITPTQTQTASARNTTTRT